MADEIEPTLLQISDRRAAKGVEIGHGWGLSEGKAVRLSG